MKKLVTLVLFLCVCVMLLKFGGYTFDSFSHEVHLRDPKDVLPLPATTANTGTNNSGGYVFDPNAKIGGGSKNNTPTETYTFDPNSSIAEVTTSEAPKATEKPNVTTPEVTKSGDSKQSDDSSAYTGLVTAPADKKTLAIEFTRIFKINLDGKEYELTSKNTASFLKWLNNSYKDNSKVEISASDVPDLSNVDNSTILNGEDLTTIINSIKTVD